MARFAGTMRTLLTNDDLKRLAGGVAVASIAGLLMGAALRPDLDEHDSSGPQMVMGDSGPRKAFAAYDAGVGAYSGALPDYVVGTDWTRPRALPAAHSDPAEDRGDVMAYAADDPVVEVAHAAYVDEPPPAPSYPSMDGATHYEADLPAPPTPPQVDIDAEPAISG